MPVSRLSPDTARGLVDAYADHVLEVLAERGLLDGEQTDDALATLASADACAQLFAAVEASRARGEPRPPAAQPAVAAVDEQCMMIFRRAVFDATCACIARELDPDAHAPRRAGQLSAGSCAFLRSMRTLVRARSAPPSAARLKAAVLASVRVRLFEPLATDAGDDISALVEQAWHRLEAEWLPLGGGDASARAEAARGLGARLPDEAALRALWRALVEQRSPPHDAHAARANYDDVCAAAAAALGADARRTLGLGGGGGCSSAERGACASLFCALRVDGHGRVALRSVAAYAARLTALLRARLLVAPYESLGPAQLSEADVETLVQDVAPSLLRLRGAAQLQSGHAFVPFYLAHATRKLVLAAEARHGRRGPPVRTRELLLSGALAQFLALGVPRARAEAGARAPRTQLPPEAVAGTASPPADGADGADGAGDDGAARSAEPNWFSIERALALYRAFLELDSDHDGMLSEEEARAFGGGTLTPAFVQRVFETSTTYDGALDYKGYLDLCLAHAERGSAHGLRFFFAALDLHGRGALHAWELSFFLREVMAGLRQSGEDDVPTELALQEVFELAQVTDGRITYAQLLACRAGDIIASVLTDVQAFWAWDNREQLIPDEDEQLPPPPADAARLFAHADVDEALPAHSARARDAEAEARVLRARCESVQLVLRALGRPVPPEPAPEPEPAAQSAGPASPPQSARRAPAANVDGTADGAEPGARAAAEEGAPGHGSLDALRPAEVQVGRAAQRAPSPAPPEADADRAAYAPTPPPPASTDSAGAAHGGARRGARVSPLAPDSPASSRHSDDSPDGRAGRPLGSPLGSPAPRAPARVEVSVSVGGVSHDVDDILRWLATTAFTERALPQPADGYAPDAPLEQPAQHHRLRIARELDVLRHAIGAQ